MARYQRGHNAGHAPYLYRGRRNSFSQKLIPSGVLRPGVEAVIGNGVVGGSLQALMEEMERSWEKEGIPVFAPA